MKLIQNRFGLLLAYSSPFVRLQVGNLPLNLIELLNVDQRLLGNLALVVGMQVEEFAARMRHATRFGHAVGDQGFVARVIVADERAAPVAEEFPACLPARLSAKS